MHEPGKNLHFLIRSLRRKVKSIILFMLSNNIYGKIVLAFIKYSVVIRLFEA